MLFVFGYRSKKIRSKKISLLIHNSENHQNIDSCTVRVFFQKIIDLVSILDTLRKSHDLTLLGLLMS